MSASTLPSVLVLHNLPSRRPAEGSAGGLESEAGVLEQVRAVSEALTRLGCPHRCAGLRTLAEARALLAAAPELVVFNLVEGLPDGAAPEEVNRVPELIEQAGKACTGNSSAALELSLDKARAKRVLLAAGLPCPAGWAVPPGEALGEGIPPPGRWIVKPVGTDASEGIDEQSVVATPAAASAAVERVHRQFAQAALVEQFVGQRELNVSVLQVGSEVRVLPLAEIDFSAFGPERARIVDYAAKWLADSFGYRHTPRILPACLPQAWARRVRDLAARAWRAFGCRDYARVDFRLDDDGRAYILEVNPNPDIAPDAGFPAALEAAGLSYEQFVEILVSNARQRWNDPHAAPAAAPADGDGVELAWSRPEDREAIRQAMVGTDFFRQDELAVAMEVLDEALDRGEGGHYQSYTLRDATGPAGWVCFGPTPCTVGTFDVYWIAVAADRQGRGYGKALLGCAEEQIRRRGGRLAIVETNGRALYHPTRQFYLRAGYEEGARVRDFYAPGDDKVIYVKRLA